MFKRRIHLSRRVGCLAALALLLSSAGGCALWHKDVWNIERFRDARAVDIDHRLDGTGPNAKNPF